ncbi:sugar transferase [Paracrocinitomix mangrovi]|uniref:sugar transferase n=1 Tax=Paracrocinitomix mangrovi TaxID=2862509 RepID=UPI001C8E241A|nr:sugar transferase [Paracrocinitomix mangrovi]UKN00131.1 sugar transferase [Paracrocinitomix mangrovi]
MRTLANSIMALVALLILLPFLLMVALIIFLADFHNPFFVQERVGLNKKTFKLIKFRSMLNDEVTLVGKVLRKTGIDELPQLLNIMSAQMFLVGPRPLTQSDISRLGWNDDYYAVRWNLRPGIIGLAQLSPVCDKKMSWYLDHYYIKNESLKLNFQILLSSVLVPFLGKQKVKKILYSK